MNATNLDALVEKWNGLFMDSSNDEPVEELRQCALEWAKEVQEEKDFLKGELDSLSNQMVFRGNSVSYIYSKCDAYKKVIGECCDQFKMDGTKSVVDYIKETIQDRDSLRAELDKVKAECAGMKEALKRYGGHDDDCWSGKATVCSCDYNKALSSTSGDELLREVQELRKDKDRLIEAAMNFNGRCRFRHNGQGQPCEKCLDCVLAEIKWRDQAIAAKEGK